jgi:acyl-CoA thioesterase
MTLEEKVVQAMLNNDKFSAWLGIKLMAIKPGYCELKMSVKKDMLNGFDILHGGVTFALADSALAFAANAHGKKSVSIEANMSYVESCKEGDELTAIANQASISKKIAVYNILVKNQEDKTVALFKGTVYRTDKEWFTD